MNIKEIEWNLLLLPTKLNHLDIYKRNLFPRQFSGEIDQLHSGQPGCEILKEEGVSLAVTSRKALGSVHPASYLMGARAHFPVVK
jgi:hypothetical protein